MKRTRIDPARDDGTPFSANFDLNLLRVLLALDRTRHVTRAAELLQMSQSGFSGALGRLRRHCGDPLFVRTAAGMVPTQRAHSMIARAAELLDAVQNDVLQPNAFEPATSTTEFHLGLADLGEIVILPRLMAHLGRVSPRTQVSTHPLPDGEMQAAMAAGQIDLALGYMPELQGQDFFRQRLYHHTFACMVRRGHPVLEGGLSLAAYCSLGHVLVTTPSRTSTHFEKSLRDRAIERRVALRTPHYLSLPSIIEATDLMATVPLAAGMRLSANANICLVALPFTPEVFDVAQYWHRRFQSDARHLWLRQQMHQLFNDESDLWRDTEVSLYGKALRHTARAMPA